jgi:hypothetical protein
MRKMFFPELKTVWLNAVSVAFTLALLWGGNAFADLIVRQVEIASLATTSRVPEVTARGRFLAPQAISAVDIGADGKFITVGTMAFSPDANVWQLGPDGTVISKRHFPPWAPMQVATLNAGRALAVGLAYSRVTSPDPTVWFGRSEELFAATLMTSWPKPTRATENSRGCDRQRRLAHRMVGQFSR